MTLAEIQALAEQKYAIVKGDCRLTRLRKRELKALYIERLKVKYGLSGRGEKVN
jgi:hypothetical protein